MHPAFHCVSNSERMYQLDFLYKYLEGVVVKILLHCQKRLLSFQNEQLFVFIDKQSAQHHKKHSGLVNETFWTRRLCEWRRRKNR